MTSEPGSKDIPVCPYKVSPNKVRDTPVLKTKAKYTHSHIE